MPVGAGVPRGRIVWSVKSRAGLSELGPCAAAQMALRKLAAGSACYRALLERQLLFSSSQLSPRRKASQGEEIRLSAEAAPRLSV